MDRSEEGGTARLAESGQSRPDDPVELLRGKQLNLSAEKQDIASTLMRGVGLVQQYVGGGHISRLAGDVDVFGSVRVGAAEQSGIAAPVHQLLLGGRETAVANSVHLQILSNGAKIDLA